MCGLKSLSDDPGNSATSNVGSSVGGVENGLMAFRLELKLSKMEMILVISTFYGINSNFTFWLFLVQEFY